MAAQDWASVLAQSDSADGRNQLAANQRWAANNPPPDTGPPHTPPPKGTSPYTTGGGSSPALQGLQDFGNMGSGMASGIGTGSAGGGGSISMGATTGAPVDTPVPETPMPSAQFGADPAGGSQSLSGPMQGRQGLGQHVPPSLAGLLKVKVY